MLKKRGLRSRSKIGKMGNISTTCVARALRHQLLQRFTRSMARDAKKKKKEAKPGDDVVEENK